MSKPKVAQRRSRRGERAKREILQAARDVARRDGIATLTIEAVAELAGLSKPAVYYHFASKEHLIRALAVQRSGEEIAAMLEAVRQATDGPAALRAFVHAYVAVHIDELELFKTQYLWSQVAGIPSEQASRDVNLKMNELFGVLEQRLEQARRKGLVHEQVHTRRAAVAAWAAAHGFVSMLALLHSSSTPLLHGAQDLLDELCEALVRGVFVDSA
jgi:AcrR family transcriptional regulator